MLLFLPDCFGPPPDRFTLTVSDGPLSVWVGSSITLPCSFFPAFIETLHTRWHRHGKYKTPLLLYEKQKLQEIPTDSQFRGRVSLDGQLEMGDVSLTLVNATLEDSGEFICFVASEKSEDHASIHLTVKALGSAPVLSVTDGGSGQVNVTCVSDGWSPQPTVTWRDREGAVIYGHSDHTATDARGFLTVTSSLLRSSSTASEWISCSVGLSEWDSKEGRILPYISETNTGPWKEVSITLLVLGLLMMFAIIALLFILCRRGNKTTTQSQDRHTQYEDDNKLEEGAFSQKQALEMPSLEMVKRFKESPTMDETTIQGDLKLGCVGKRVTCSKPICSATLNISNYVLCRDKFGSGQHYWEINVSDKLSWCVGVCSDALRGQGGMSLTQSDCWLLCFNKGDGLFVKKKTETPVLTAGTSISTVGVYLDCSGDSLTFYDVESKSCLFTFHDVSSAHPLVPVLSPGGRDNSVMALID